MKEGISPQFPREHFARPQLTRRSFAKVSSLWASSSLFRVAGDGPRENALASPFACRSRVTSHGISPTACSQARQYSARTTPFFAESRFFMVKICFNIACYIGCTNDGYNIALMYSLYYLLTTSKYVKNAKVYFKKLYYLSKERTK